jgi:hypothetical protein
MKTSDNEIVCLVQYDEVKLIIEKNMIKDNHIRVSVPAYDNNGEYSPYTELKKVEVLDTYLVNLYADFIYKENYWDKNSLTEPLMSSRGGGFSNPAGLKYFYNVMIAEISGDYESIIYKDNGVKTTRFDRYSYPVRPLTEPTQYNTESILYELYQSLDLNKILIK